MTNKPNIIELIQAAGVPLRRAGRDFIGLCPFHEEKTPSLTVSEEKGLYHCFGCDAGGDSIEFVRKFYGVSFKAALRILNLETAGPTPESVRRREKAIRIAAWARALSRRVNDELLEIGNDAYVCREGLKVDYTDHDLLRDELQRLGRKWNILVSFDADLNAKTAVELWTMRKDIDALVDEL